MFSQTTEDLIVASGWKHQQEVRSRRVPFQFATHTQYVSMTLPKFSNFHELSPSADLRRFLALANAEVTVDIEGGGSSIEESSKRVTIPVQRGALVLAEEFRETDPCEYSWWMVSVPSDTDGLVEGILGGVDR